MSKQKASYKFHYFPVRGRGDFIRYILEYVDAPYEEVFVDREDWPKVKPSNLESIVDRCKCHQFCSRLLEGIEGIERVNQTGHWNDAPSRENEMPMGVLPVLELPGGQQLSQSLAIGRYLATKHGLISDDAFENAWGDQLASAIEDVYAPYYKPYVIATFLEPDEKKKKEAWEEMKTKGITPLFGTFEKFLGGKQWFCGDKIHWADLVIAEFVDRIETIFEKGFTAPKFPKLYAHMQRVHEIPSIKKYVEVRPDYVV